jgi:hypothetical protein
MAVTAVDGLLYHDLFRDNEAGRRGGLPGHHGDGGAFREPEMWAICRSNSMAGWS